MKKVIRLLPAEEVDMGGMPVLQPLPTYQVQQVDPFLLLHHHKGHIKPGSNPRSTGVGPHPHRGFMPVTFIIEGNVHHRDSMGNSQVVHEGGIQWVNAGSGMTHSERPSGDLAEEGGIQEILQLWINLPARLKGAAPTYLSAQRDEVETWTENGVEVQLFSGDYLEHRGRISSPYPILSLMLHLPKGKEWNGVLPEDSNTLLYLIRGNVRMKGFGNIDEKTMIQLSSIGKEVGIEALDDAMVLVLSGSPIDEKVTSYGPFVMNTQTEILEALRDAQSGRMGFLVEEF
ncbi:MAG: pirin family protein [Bacteroidota bacterium]|nr:pirin family protein [Bacteroidota bacterium]